MAANRPSKVPFGNRRGHALCNMSQSQRLDFIAEGLPLIFSSMRGFWEAAERLDENPREAAVLEGFAEEEAAKALILVDLVRCPPSKVAGRLGRIIDTFYSHLARLIYAKAQSWRPVNLTQLQEYVDTERQAHYLEGGMSEYIVPNWAIYSREALLYADIEMHEDGIAQWNDPRTLSAMRISLRPPALDLVEALGALGVFSRAGLQALNEIWGKVDFRDQEGPETNRELTKSFAGRLDAEVLVTDSATDEHVRTFYHFWQLPMYNLEFDMLQVPLEDLVAQRDAAFWNEVGY